MNDAVKSGMTNKEPAEVHISGQMPMNGVGMRQLRQGIFPVPGLSQYSGADVRVGLVTDPVTGEKHTVLKFNEAAAQSEGAISKALAWAKNNIPGGEITHMRGPTGFKCDVEDASPYLINFRLSIPTTPIRPTKIPGSATQPKRFDQ